MPLYTDSQRPLPENNAHADDNKTAAQAFSTHLIDSTKYNLLQTPINGVGQLIDHGLGTKILPHLQLFAPPTKSELGTAAFAGDVAGGALAAAVPMILLHKYIGPGAAGKLELSAEYGLNRAAAPALSKSITAGALYGGILAPSDESESIFSGRLKNATVSALSLATLTAGSIGLKSTGSAFLGNDIMAAGVSGSMAGVVSADGHSLLSGHGFASGDERLKSAINFAAGGMFNGAANSAHEFLAPTSGIRGVRTLTDMTKLAESTMVPGAPVRYQYESQQAIPPKAELLQTGNMAEWYNRTAKYLREEIDNSNMPQEWRKQLVSGHQDLTYGFEALHNRPEPKPILVVYGSARFKENDFRYQRARYIGGRAVQEGYDVMTGGGPGTMEAANRGAYEAGGNSIGVVLKLPHEKRGNGYQTLTLKHRYFYTRLENLKKGYAFVAEDGGIGTGAEGLDTLTHIQTGKMKGAPFFFVGREKYAHLEGLLAQMEKDGTISPSDRKLYKIVDNPDDIFAELAKLNKEKEQETNRLRAGQYPASLRLNEAPVI